MPCCALRKRKKQLMIVPVFLLFAVALFGGLLLGIYALGGIFSRGLAEKRSRTAKTVGKLAGGLSDRILNEPFLFDSAVRCRLSGRIMGISAPLAGGIYKYFNILVFGSLAVTIYLLIKGISLL
jgi:hypothetical protein